jgi:hypothetical protein
MKGMRRSAAMLGILGAMFGGKTTAQMQDDTKTITLQAPPMLEPYYPTYSSPIFMPRQHSILSYRGQSRAAKKRNNIRKRSKH